MSYGQFADTVLEVWIRTAGNGSGGWVPARADSRGSDGSRAAKQHSADTLRCESKVAMHCYGFGTAAQTLADLTLCSATSACTNGRAGHRRSQPPAAICAQACHSPRSETQTGSSSIMPHLDVLSEQFASLDDDLAVDHRGRHVARGAQQQGGHGVVQTARERDVVRQLRKDMKTRSSCRHDQHQSRCQRQFEPCMQRSCHEHGHPAPMHGAGRCQSSPRTSHGPPRARPPRHTCQNSARNVLPTPRPLGSDAVPRQVMIPAPHPASPRPGRSPPVHLPSIPQSRRRSRARSLPASPSIRAPLRRPWSQSPGPRAL